jgi:xylulose-5-phosphate/fructose-6-phosphate phosphoketolase
MDVLDRVPGLSPSAAHLKQMARNKLIEHKEYIRKYGQDLPEIREWQWGG